MKKLLLIFWSMALLTNAQESIYNIEIKSITNETINLKEFTGKKLLFVNVASNCGFTDQYKELEKLHQLYKHKLVVIGVPCNQFGGQEPAGHKEIISFCKENYGVTFILTEKIDVKGSNQHPLYKWLCSKEKNERSNSNVKWNFQKYLIDEKGGFLDFFYSVTQPMSPKITSYLL